MRYHNRRHRHKSGYGRGRGHYQRFRDHMEDITSGQNGIYRSRRGMAMGVCRGLAERFNLSVFWTRMITFICFLFTGFWPVGVLYIIAGLVLKLEPVTPFEDEYDQEFYHSYTNSRESAIQRIKKKFENIDRRIQRMEHTVCSREFDTL